MKDTILIDQKTGKKYKLMEIQETEKYAFIIGHTEKDKGAYSEHLKIQEWDIFKNFANAFLTDSGDIFTHNKDISSYTQRQTDTAQKTAQYKYSFELHFNAASPKAQGCEALYYYKNEEARMIAEKYCSLMVQEMGIKSRGAKALRDGDRGFGFVQKQKPTALILEPFFGSNIEDCKNFDMVKYSAVIYKLLEFINETF